MSDHIVIALPEPVPGHGGIAVMMTELAKAFEGAGHRVTMLASRRSPDEPDRFERGRIVVHRIDRRRYLHRYQLHQHRYDREMEGWIRARLDADRPNSMLLGHPHVWDQAALACCRAWGIPLGVYAHGAEIRQLIVRPPRLPQRALGVGGWLPTLHTRTRRVLKQASVRFANSTYTARLIETYSGRPAEVTGCGLSPSALSHGIRLSRRMTAGEVARVRNDIGVGEGPILSFLGRVVRDKNVEILLRLASDMPHLQVVIMGEGKDRRRLMERSARQGLSDRIHWLGFVPEGKKWEVLGASDVFCLPSRPNEEGSVEGFGIVLLEAAAAGTPVVAANAGGIVDVVDESTGVLFDPDDVDDLRRAVERVLARPHDAHDTVEGLRQRIRDRFNWPVVAGHVLHSLQAATPPPRAA